MSCDAYDMWRAREAELERRLAKYPECCHCGRKIQDECLFDINGALFHEECARGEFLKWTEDYET